MERQINTDWSQFWSENMFLTACEICQLVADKYRKGQIDDLIPVNDTECSKESTQNPYCGLVKNITKDLNATFPDEIPKNACETITPCIYSSKEFSGPLCYSCRLFYHIYHSINVTDKVAHMKKLCITSRSTFADLCSGLEFSSTQKFWTNLEKSKNSLQQCRPFCHRPGERPMKQRRPHRGSQEL
ncbi:hypothetical protein TVAG_211300 [Trichomonas vaginalis G3]|uniref:Uncharacterized protein n=2 Tax=Trichomonas vaginalis (strain ATCC PRA-98 / G3) TaxID=412133 RepID=A2EKX2_TRIV3|nr:hypothetical protein TVAG_211300 [Trichomonas vaginalis G3]|eukprot:XP_001318903.1 hypothetical protein [Trichomonas vaginalis G3]